MDKEIILSILGIKEQDIYNLNSLILMSISQNDIDNNDLYNLHDFLLLKKILFIQKIELLYNIDIKDEDLENIKTLDDILNMIKTTNIRK